MRNKAQKICVVSPLSPLIGGCRTPRTITRSVHHRKQATAAQATQATARKGEGTRGWQEDEQLVPVSFRS